MKWVAAYIAFLAVSAAGCAAMATVFSARHHWIDFGFAVAATAGLLYSLLDFGAYVWRSRRS